MPQGCILPQLSVSTFPPCHSGGLTRAHQVYLELDPRTQRVLAQDRCRRAKVGIGQAAVGLPTARAIATVKVILQYPHFT
jgi:hypothetical protein